MAPKYSSGDQHAKEPPNYAMSPSVWYMFEDIRSFAASHRSMRNPCGAIRIGQSRKKVAAALLNQCDPNLLLFQTWDGSIACYHLPSDVMSPVIKL